MIVKQNRMILLLAAVLLLAQWLMPVAVSAAEPLDPNRDCELTISLNYQGKPVSGASYNLYRVADVSETGKFTICAPFTDYPIEFSDMTTENSVLWHKRWIPSLKWTGFRRILKV